MATLTKPRVPVKTELVSAEVYAVMGNVTLRLVTRTGTREQTNWFHVARLDCEDTAFELKKFSDHPGTDPEENVYHVNLSDLSCGCSCRGYLAYQHCKHHGGIRLAVKGGAL
jgi:hypothetical protein